MNRLIESIKITKQRLGAIAFAIKAAIRYEKATERKLGITGEVAEVLVSHRLKLRLLVDPIYPGCDAIDSKNNCYQIKGARRLGDLHEGRMGTISRHKYDYLILALLDFDYKIKEIYKLPSNSAEKIARRHRRRNPPIHSIAHKEWRIK